MKKFISLGAIFVLAFSSVYLLRNWGDGGGLFGREDAGQFTPEKATLQGEPAIDAAEVPGLVRANDEMVKLVEKVTPSVVSIDTEIVRQEKVLDPLRQRFYLRDRLTPGLGSGVIVSEEGHVITNHHVIEGHSKIRVTLHDERSFAAYLIASDKILDIAVLKIQTGRKKMRFEPLKFADSDSVKVGQLAIAVGNPFGLGESVTVGRISARDRSLSDGQSDLFQTDAAINPGNSGGPLLNHLGEIIAINASIYSQNRENPAFQGIGFSIPANDVRRALEHILKIGRPVHGYLGVATQDFNNYTRSVYDHEGAGVIVAEVVPESPADEAGLRPHDILVAYDGEEVTSTEGFLMRVKRSEVGLAKTLEIIRGGERLTLEVRAADADQLTSLDPPGGSERLSGDRSIATAVGLDVQNLSQIYRAQGVRGVFVRRVLQGSLAEEAGFQANDLIMTINDIPIRDMRDFYIRLVATAASRETRLLVRRGRQSQVLTVPRVLLEEAD